MTARILLVEDDPKLAQFVETELSLKGYCVTVALNGMDGLSLARDIQPDLLILDWLMPGKLTCI
jgi:DNA-binding response OmpR family regulator